MTVAKDFHNIKFAIEDRVARITFARPSLNIFNIAMMREIGDALNDCSDQNDLVAIVFDAAEGSRAFSAGVAVEEHVPETVIEMLDSFHDIFRKLNQISRPAIAVVNGAALGGGCELVAACDIVIASDRAKFGQPEIKLGVFPPVAAILLPRIIGEKKARAMILTGETIDAAEALRLGLVSHLVPGDSLQQTANEVLARLRELSSSSLAMTRRAIDIAGGADFSHSLEQVENLYLQALMKTEDANEGLRSFMEKRKPEWRNR
ncbi:MAG TPA: enoyl-CoA hydratase-related protein [Pyrinomonadaceae bacterium]|nr:enoyl-CoA hydratase-related protein [Pyrinomonadaceae bacterium]